MRHKETLAETSGEKLLLFLAGSKNGEGIGPGALPLSYYPGKCEIEVNIVNGFSERYSQEIYLARDTYG